MQPFEYRSVRLWPTEINGTLIRGRKNLFLDVAILTLPPWRACRWNPVNSWSRGLSDVALGPYETCASAYTARAAASIGRDI